MRTLLIALAIVFGASLAHAADASKLTVAQALNLLTALRNLDGHLVIIKQNGGEGTVMVPWEFGSGALRLAIAHDIDVLTPNEKALGEARRSILKELGDIKPGSKEAEEFSRQIEQAMSTPALGAAELTHIKASDLKLDKNEIPVTVLSALGPILEQ